ncbi:hypothetical protein HDU96_001644 [Phlyctochytrium bullatum]|nr:hypothetical protein HDU96_001644 [Phlyctochytrium bullatum]
MKNILDDIGTQLAANESSTNNIEMMPRRGSQRGSMDHEGTPGRLSGDVAARTSPVFGTNYWNGVGTETLWDSHPIDPKSLEAGTATGASTSLYHRRGSGGELSNASGEGKGSSVGSFDDDDIFLLDSSSDSLNKTTAATWKTRRKSNPPPRITTNGSTGSNSVIFASPAGTPTRQQKTPAGVLSGGRSSYSAVPLSPVYDILSTGGVERSKPFKLEDVGNVPETHFLKALLKLADAIAVHEQSEGGGAGETAPVSASRPPKSLRVDRLKALVKRRLLAITANDDAARVSR